MAHFQASICYLSVSIKSDTSERKSLKRLCLSVSECSYMLSSTVSAIHEIVIFTRAADNTDVEIQMSIRSSDLEHAAL